MDPSVAMNPDMSLLKRSAQFVYSLFKTSLSESLIYHDLQHTRQVVKAARRIGKGVGLLPADLEIVLIAAWFHDAGFVDVYDGHEDRGAEIAEEFLAAQGCPNDVVQLIAGCIRATRVPQSPQNLLEEVLCDADLAHLSSPDFDVRNEMLRLEWQHVLGRKMTDLEWERTSFDFMSQLTFHTRYAERKFHAGRAHNLRILAQRIRDLEEREAATRERARLAHEDAAARKAMRERIVDASIAAASARSEQQAERTRLIQVDIDARNRARERRTDAHIEALTARAMLDRRRLREVEDAGRRDAVGMETMFRTMADNHARLATNVDGKGNMLILVSLLLLSLGLLPLLVPRARIGLPDVAAMVLVVTSVWAMIVAVNVVRPRKTAGGPSVDSEGKSRKSLLFFGNFHGMSVEEYREQVEAMASDAASLRENLIRDTYFAGKALARKNRHLRIAYAILIAGAVIAALFTVLHALRMVLYRM